ncbi:hypothetical protein Fmac_004288 [Flemingia macrophylla]|uniref:Uncharacterized protein n=1 Tax=Flemingia macrophylla TaxID=520843 RepID=A0ABD1N4H2_9FABA
METTELGFRKPLSKEEKVLKKKERLPAIVLDGIGNGKGLDPRFDITEIAKLTSERDGNWDRQSQAFYNIFRQAERVEKLAEIIQKLAPATIAYVFCAIFGFQVLFGIVKINKLDERERLI